MKRTILLTAVLLANLLFFTNCEKDTLPTSTNPSGKLKAAPIPFVSISLTTGTTCGTYTPYGEEFATNTKVNVVNVDNNTSAFFSTLTYTYYKKIGNIGKNFELYEPLPNAQYTSSNLTVGLAQGYLVNDAKILVIANENTSSGPPLTTNLKLNTQYNTLWTLSGVQFSMPSLFDFKTINMGNTAGDPCSGWDTN